ncbi:bifunctional diaminohydroxyphosphoribosylaminopyrimidine deaminase/5-amino-6-(5-phosphoribosylamino)uracil reductase RibD [Haliangium ochraceum]|nr:bifunctional diaminohydroxyphosphoribosylaminopyrimidine deaminase/5-amino-6-(5-phosphoribosylamino)uracil reductase RibD [Haliangium ochraceum]
MSRTGRRACARPPSADGSGDETQRALDEQYMARCLELARRAEGRTAPNPMVGCVIVAPSGEVIAEGYHRRAGAPHAEAEALAQLDGRAPGCTMYVNLEPCRHRRKRRTVPCAPAVAEAGIARLVVGMGDPIRSHAGGAAWLARQGVSVTRGVLRADCRDLNRGFITRARKGRPWFALKAAMTLDGKVATRTGDSQWITGPQARAHGHGLRDRLDAMLVGIGTVLADDPRLTARGARDARDPVRVVVDSRLRTPLDARLLPANTSSPARTIIAASERAPRTRERRLADAGAEVWRVGAGPRVDLEALAQRLAAAELNTVLVEGGAELHAAFVAADLADELLLYVAPMVLGGRGRDSGLGWLGGAGVERLADATRFSFRGDSESLGEDRLLRLRRRNWR